MTPLSWPDLGRIARRGIVLCTTLLAGCALLGGGSRPTASSSPAASASARPSPRAGAACVTHAGEARVVLQTATEENSPPQRIVLHDPAANAFSRELLKLSDSGLPPNPKFVGRDIVSYIKQGTAPGQQAEIAEVSTQGGEPHTVVAIGGPVYAYAWSHEGAKLMYLSQASGGQAQVHQFVPGDDRVVATLGNVVGRGGSSDDQFLLDFSCDDQLLLVVDTSLSTGSDPTVVAPSLRVYRVSAATITEVFAPSSATQPIGKSATMAAWAPTRPQLYYRDDAGVHAWDALTNSERQIAAGLRWYEPRFSPDGKLVTYTIYEAGTPRVGLYDLSTGSTSTVGQPLRGDPTFVSNHVIWYLGQQACSGPCDFVASGKAYQYDLGTGQAGSLQLNDLAASDVSWS